MMALLKALWKLRPPGEPEAPGARLLRRWREKHLLKRLEREWPGGFTLHRTGDLVYVPAPLDARGRQALLHPPRVHPAVLGFLPAGAVVIDIGANLGEWTVPLARAVVGGLLTSTFLTLIIVPILYTLLNREQFKYAWIDNNWRPS